MKKKKWAACAGWLAAAMVVMGSGVWGADSTENPPPAKVRVVVVDGHGKAVGGVEVRMKRMASSNQEAVRGATDGQGKVELTQQNGEEAGAWWETLEVRQEGMKPQTLNVMVFAGAEVEQRVELARVTKVRVVGPGGEAVAGVELSISTDGALHVSVAGEQMRTNEKGEYRWEHGTVTGHADVSVLGESFLRGTTPFIREANRIVRKVGVPEVGADTGEITIALTVEELAKVGKEAIVEGKLLLADGAPAAGWQVGERVRFTGAGGIISGVILSENMTNYYAAERLVKAGPDGGFRVGAGEALLVVSPEGTPFLYALNPEAWEAGRKLTLQLPERRREIRGQMVDEGGKALPGVEIWAYAMRSGGRAWQYSIAGDAAKKDVGRIVTDAAGKYALPVYGGAVAVQYQPGSVGHIEWYGADLADGGRVVMKSYAAAARQESVKLKNVTVVLANEKGEAIAGLAAAESTAYSAAGGVVSSSGMAVMDVHGGHFFVDKNAAALEIKVTGKGWNAMKKRLELQGTGDQRVVVTVDERSRMKPLGGRVVDGSGKGSGGVEVSLFGPPPEYAPGNGPQYLGLKTQTDEEGKFAFAGAPDECAINLLHFDVTGIGQDIPPVEPVPVTAGKREVQIRLRPAGSVRIVLPEAVARMTALDKQEGVGREMALRREEGGKRVAGGSLIYDAATRSLVGRGLVTGTYWPERDAIEIMGDVSGEAIEVKAGAETVVDWSKRRLAAWAKPHEERWVNVKLAAEGKAVSGAEVQVFTCTYRPEKVAEWVQQWKRGEMMTTVERALCAAGGATEKALAETTGDAAFKAWAEGMPAQMEKYGDGLMQVTADLSDESGMVRFKGEVGREYVAVGRVRGKWMGWSRWTVAATGDGAVEMKAARGLLAKVGENAEGGPVYERDEVFVRLVKMDGMERRALVRVLVWDLPWGGGGVAPVWMKMQREGVGMRMQEDLPVGAECEVKVAGSWGRVPDDAKEAKSVVIEAGAGMQEVGMEGGGSGK